MKRYPQHVLTLMAATALLLTSGLAVGQTIAYDAPVQPGNQNFTGNLGLDFNVVKPIIVESLGIFDSNAGAKPPTVPSGIQVAIFNRVTGLTVGPTVTFSGTGTIINGDAFQAITPFILPVGQYSVVAVGFGIGNANGNSTLPPPFTASTENTGGGAVTFVGAGTARFDNNATLDFPPTTVFAPAPSNVFLAGTFQFDVLTAPGISKAFGSKSFHVGETTSLSFTISNSNSLQLTGVGFTDTLPPGLLIATPNGLTGSCGGGPITATAGSNTISLSGAALLAGTNCTFSVNVLATTIGVQTNVTSTITSTQTGAGGVASAAITVLPPLDAFQVRYAANLNIGDSYLNITNTGAGANGNLCANIYTFDPAEELISCCTCSVTPNGLQSLSIRNSLISNPLTPSIPTAVVVKIAATTGTCNAATAATANLAQGLIAWGTSLHQNSSVAAATYSVTETKFSNAEISAAELAHITSTCGFIQADGSGFGICKGCAAGGLGASATQ